MSARATYLDGAIAGVIGAAIIALWFLFLDAFTRLPLYTPTILGEGLFVRGQEIASRAGAHPSLKFTLLYSGVHGLVFVALGVIAAYLLLLAKKRLTLGVSILVLFGVLQLGFLGTASVFIEPVLSEIAWWSVLLGNFLAATGMAGYLQLRSGRLKEQL